MNTKNTRMSAFDFWIKDGKIRTDINEYLIGVTHEEVCTHVFQAPEAWQHYSETELQSAVYRMLPMGCEDFRYAVSYYRWYQPEYDVLVRRIHRNAPDAADEDKEVLPDKTNIGFEYKNVMYGVNALYNNIVIIHPDVKVNEVATLEVREFEQGDIIWYLKPKEPEKESPFVSKMREKFERMKEEAKLEYAKAERAYSLEKSEENLLAKQQAWIHLHNVEGDNLVEGEFTFVPDGIYDTMSSPEITKFPFRDYFRAAEVYSERLYRKESKPFYNEHEYRRGWNVQKFHYERRGKDVIKVYTNDSGVAYGLKQIDREQMVEVAERYAKAYGYQNFTQEGYGKNSSKPATLRGNNFFHTERSYVKKAYGDTPERIGKIDTAGAVKDRIGSVTNSSLYEFYELIEFLEAFPEYKEDLLDVDYRLCPHCGEPVYAPQFHTEDILCELCDTVIAPAQEFDTVREFYHGCAEVGYLNEEGTDDVDDADIYAFYEEESEEE